MIFDVKASKGKRVLYAIVNAMMILFLLFWVRVLFGILEETNTVGSLIIMGIIWISLTVLFIYAIYTVIYAMHMVITVDCSDKTLTIKRFMRRPVTISVYDITSWKVKNVNGKTGEVSRNLFINYEGGQIKVVSLLDHWERLRLFLADNASDKLNGDLGKEETGYSYLSAQELNDIMKEASNLPLTFEQKTAETFGHMLEAELPYNYMVDCMLFKAGEEPLLESFRESLKNEWIDDDQYDTIAKLKNITFEVKSENESFEDFLEKRLSNYDISKTALRKHAHELLESLSKDLGNPICFYSTADSLDFDTENALHEITIQDNILQLFFIEFSEYILSVQVSMFE